MYHNKLCPLALACAFAVLPLFINSAAFAVPPDSGQVMQNAQNGMSQPMGTTQLPAIAISAEPDNSPVDHSGPTVHVSGFKIEGDTGVNPNAIDNITRSSVGKDLSLGEIKSVADTITRYLRARGYMVARAYVPAQQVAGGVINITIVLGTYGAIDVRNDSTLDGKFLSSLVGQLHVGDTIRQYTLERVLLLLTDVPGVKIQSTLSAGADPGTSDLTIDVTNDQRVQGEVSTDNWGDKYTGRYRAGFLLDLKNLDKLGDTLNLGDDYAGAGLNDYQLGYELPTGPFGGKLSINYSRMHYELGQNYSSIGATGLADVTTVTESYPFIRSRWFNLSGQAGADLKILKDDISSVQSDSLKRDSLVQIGLSGDLKEMNGSGDTTFALDAEQGSLSMESADAAANDSLDTGGSWSKETLNVVRQKYTAKRLSYYASFNGQLAGKNLDSSEQLILGGASGVRSYPQGEASGDEGYIATGELHWDMPTPALQLAGFVDYGSVELAKNPLQTSGNTVDLGGIGLGIISHTKDGYNLRVDYAFKTTGYKAISDSNENGRFWFRLNRDF